MKPLERVNKTKDLVSSIVEIMPTYQMVYAYFHLYDSNVLYYEDGYGNSPFSSLDEYTNSLLFNVSEDIFESIYDEIFNSKAGHGVPSVTDIWRPGYYRMFISHVSSYNSSASNLKTALEDYGISGFVAHKDIEPSKEWQGELEKALFSMDCLCGIITDDFNESKWCDQELGIAIGEGKPLVLIKKGALPYGFAGKYQAIESKSNAPDMAKKVFEIIAKNPKFNAVYNEKLKDLLLNAKSGDDAQKWFRLITKLPGVTPSFVSSIRDRLKDNENLLSEEFIKSFNSFAKKYGVTPYTKSVPVSVEDDDLPF